MKVLASEQVQTWLNCLAPDSKHRVRMALRQLAERRADVLPLEAELEGFHRLRVGGLRIIFSRMPGFVIQLEYADVREFVYERFLEILKGRAPGS